MIDEGQRYNPQKLTQQRRAEFARKAKADSLAWEAAKLLSSGKLPEALTLIDGAAALVGRDRAVFWLRHYAVMKFRVLPAMVDRLSNRADRAAA